MHRTENIAAQCRSLGWEGAHETGGRTQVTGNPTALFPSPTVNVVSCNAKVWEDLHRLPHIEGVPLNSACYLVQGGSK